MGADEKSILKKCGEILVNIKARNKKSKIYTFNCAFCGVNCDQLKKFSLHIDEKHLQEISEEESEVKTVIYVPEIKTEELNNIETKHELQETVALPLYEDPLETIDPVVKDIESADITMELEIKEEEIKNPDFEMDFEDNDFNRDDIDYQDCPEDNDDDIYSESESSGSEYKAKTKNMSLGKRKKVKISEKKTSNKSKTKGNTIDEAKNHINPNEEMATEIDDRELCIALLEALKKQTVLWKVNERTKFKNVNEKYFKIVANEVNEKLKSTLTWEDARRHIKTMRDHYTQEMQKQALEEDFELPWYSEHMAFLQENIKLLLRRRKTGPRYTPLKTMDDSQLSILIDVYKKHDSLWQVNNIAFGAKRKKEEAFEKIVEELNSNYNQNVTVAYLHRRVSYMLRTYSENKKLQLNCELEKRSFQPSTPLYDKMSFLSECQGPFKCSQCNEIIERYDNYRVHVAKHDDTVPFPCPICKSSFQKFGYYIIHARRHMDLNIHFCKFCNKGFPFTTELEIHERSHTGELPYLCQICGAKFRAPHSYRNHIRRHENRFLYECHICSHGFNHSNELNDHVKAHLNIRDIVCNVCDKSFTSKKRLRIHQHIHSEEKRYKCTVCGKAFSQASGLRQHRKQHQPFSVLHKKESTLNFGNI